MKIHLFAVKLERPLTGEESAALMRVLPGERRKRLMRVRLPERRDEPLCAYGALYLAVQSLYGWQSLPKLCYNEYGKPAFEGHPDVQFNISHTRGAVLVGLHNEPLGVDIEKLRPIRGKMLRRAADTTSPEAFFESWVRRESRAKRSGTGIRSVREEEPSSCERIVPLDTFPNYAACLCTCSDAPAAPVRRFVLR